MPHNILELASLQQSFVDVNTSACVPYVPETIREEFIRISQYFKQGSAIQLIVVNDLPNKDEALRIYALTQQAQFGDVQGDRPKIWDPIERAKWDAWATTQGMTRTAAR